MPKISYFFAVALVFSVLAHAQVFAADTGSELDGTLKKLEAARAQDEAKLSDLEERLADNDAKLSRWQPLIQNTMRLDEWIHSAEGRRLVQKLNVKPDPRNVRAELALRISALAAEKEILADDAAQLKASIAKDRTHLARLRSANVLAETRH